MAWRNSPGALELFGQEAGVAETSVLGSDGEDGDVAVPGESVGGGGEVEWGGLEFAHYCSKRKRDEVSGIGLERGMWAEPKGDGAVLYCSLLFCRVLLCIGRARAIS